MLKTQDRNEMSLVFPPGSCNAEQDKLVIFQSRKEHYRDSAFPFTTAALFSVRVSTLAECAVPIMVPTLFPPEVMM